MNIQWLLQFIDTSEFIILVQVITYKLLLPEICFIFTECKSPFKKGIRSAGHV